MTDASGTTTYNYSLMGDKITFEERTGANACDMYYAYDANGKLYGVYYNGTFYFYKRNIQGDIIGLLNTSGTEVVIYKYGTWGKLLSIDADSGYEALGERNPFRYRGYYYDMETGLYYLNQRYYNPEWGRFINADDVLGEKGELLSHNTYAYCKNNSIIREDPKGSSATLIAMGVGAAVGLVGQYASDAISSLINGEVEYSNWQTYVGAAAGGALGGLCYQGGPIVSGAVTAGSTTLISRGLQKFTIEDYQETWGDIFLNSGFDALAGAGLGAIPGINTITKGRNSMSAVFKSGLTKLQNGTALNMSVLTKLKGTTANIVAGLPLDCFMDLDNQYLIGAGG